VHNQPQLRNCQLSGQIPRLLQDVHFEYSIPTRVTYLQPAFERYSQAFQQKKTPTYTSALAGNKQARQ
jgi:hypothetical protein